MAELLPPKSSEPTPDRVRQLEVALGQLISNNPRIIDEACGFYDVIDRYLGPWGQDGYPIGYGKYYCVAFNMNQKLRRNNTTWSWVTKTTTALQNGLKNFIVEQYRAGKLSNLTEAELRSYAFDSHPSAYTKGGLAHVILYAPEMLDVIMSIPGAEFSPASENFGASVKQVFVTAGLQAPRIATAAIGLPALALIGPAHTGILARAARRDLNQMARTQSEIRGLSSMLTKLRNGELDNMTVLDSLIKQLHYRRYGDHYLRRFANEVIGEAEKRKLYVNKFYQSLPKGAPKVAP